MQQLKTDEGQVLAYLMSINGKLEGIDKELKHFGKNFDKMEQQITDLKTELKEEINGVSDSAGEAEKKADAALLQIADQGKDIDRLFQKFREHEASEKTEFEKVNVRIDAQDTKQIEQRRWLVGTIIAVAAIIVPTVMALL